MELYLTEREKDVIQLICEGYSNAEIATVLFISKHTVKRHVLSILNKLSAKNRTNAAFIYAKSLNKNL